MFIYMVASTHKTCPLVSPSEKYAHWCPLEASMRALQTTDQNTGVEFWSTNLDRSQPRLCPTSLASNGGPLAPREECHLAERDDHHTYCQPELCGPYRGLFHNSLWYMMLGSSEPLEACRVGRSGVGDRPLTFLTEH